MNFQKNCLKFATSDIFYSVFVAKTFDEINKSPPIAFSFPQRSVKGFTLRKQNNQE